MTLVDLARTVEVELEEPVVPGLSRFEWDGEEWLIVGRRGDVYTARRLCQVTQC